MSNVASDWLPYFTAESKKEYYVNLAKKVRDEYNRHTCFPPKEDVFAAFQYTSLENVKVVILGQDPYHNVGQAHGLCFSVQNGVEIPPSLVNIYQEIHDDVGCYIPNNGTLTKWAKQGVLLLNTVLTVRAHEANSHRGIGWETFTDRVIEIVNEKNAPVVFLLWGSPAAKKEALLNNPNHLVLKAPHPSPLSAYRGFFGCRHFSKTNEFLEKNGVDPIDWQIENIVQ
ncbi:MAG: uracil-DNA glycosylase [Lachnospiraceae bacterium]|nr:uracil-DNA glycosylase [Lachnospiraceae bacterium]